MSAPEIHPFLRERWSTRRFDLSYELEGNDLARLLEAARWSPSAGNSQPWAFLVACRGDAAHDRFTATLSRGNTGWVPNASVVLITLHRIGADEDPSLTYSDYAAYDLGQAVAHLNIQAQAMGLAVHQFAGFDHDAVAAAFAVPPAWKVTTGIAIGRHVDQSPDDDAAEQGQRPRIRNDFDAFVFGGAFGEPVSL